ncbi:SH3 domain-containing protein [Nostoc sp. FACHB-110]|uniref:SH3 domain-containing protein n=1 Tax=Nostoc sp. FACHB-110 TaxID=2692834 RepID=UPI0016874CAA|nr:SH3 domain-containing protein [Nostoc sp. FACHB-110]MBD2436878.1 SH3 domain-containing protein [Nostoc sp. FACHB-110]
MQQVKYLQKLILLFTSVTILPVFAIAYDGRYQMIAPVVAQSSCEDITKQIPPSSTLREIKLDKFGVVFKIPRNYRTTNTTKQNQGQYIEVFSPAEYEYLECLNHNSIGGDIDSTAGISIVPTNGKYQTIPEFTKSGLISDNFARLLKKTKIAGQPAFIYEASRKGLITAVFLSSDKQLGIAIDTLNEDNSPVINHIFNDILTSFKFGTKTAESQTRQTTASATQVNHQGCVDNRELKKGPLEFYIIYDPEIHSSNSPASIRIRENPSTESAVVHVASSGNPVIIYQQVVRDNYCWLKVDVTSISKDDPTSYITVRGWVRGDFVTGDKSP